MIESGGSTNVAEGGATDTYTVALDSQPTANVKINMKNSDGQVTARDDANPANAYLTFTPSNWNIPQTVRVTAVDDNVVEGSHHGVITHTSSSDNSAFNNISIASVTANITDNDTANISVNDVTNWEGSSGGTTSFTFTVTLSKAAASNVTVDYATADGTATTMDNDYTATSGTLTFRPGASLTQTVTVSVTADTKVESNETFYLNLTNAKFGGVVDPTLVAMSDAQGVGTILTDNASTRATVGINTSQVLRTVDGSMFGTNVTWWQWELTSPQMEEMVRNSGMKLFRMPGGSSANSFHFNDPPPYDGYNTAPMMAEFIESVGGDGMVTLDYGEGSPQSGGVFVISQRPARRSDRYWHGPAVEQQHQHVGAKGLADGRLLGQSAGLCPLEVDDGLNFLRINHPAPFNFTYFEVGNEDYAVWETDMHGQGGDSGAPQNPATYVTFAKTFSDLAHQIYPNVKIGLDTSPALLWNMPDANWTADCLAACKQKGFVPDFLSDHTYIKGYYDSHYQFHAFTDAQLLVNTVNDPSFSYTDYAVGYRSLGNWANKAAWYRTQISNQLGSAGANIQLMETEFNCNIDNKQSTSLVGGLWMADAIGGLLQTEFTVALQWDLTNGFNSLTADPSHYGWREGSDNGMISTGSYNPPISGPYITYPEYFAEELWSKIIRDGDQVLNVASNNPNLTVYAVHEADGYMGLMIINKDPSNAVTCSFNFTGFAPNSTATYWRYGEAEDTAQSLSSDGSASLTTGTAPLTVMGGSFSYSFPSYSMTVFDLAPITGPTLPPQAPSDLVADASSSSQINLTWTDNSPHEALFKIERSLNGSTGWTQIGVVCANVTSYSDTGLSPGTHYYYRVRAYNIAGDSAYTNTTGAMTYQAQSGNIFTANGDIGSPGATGFSSYAGGTYTIAGSGADIWGTSDQFQFDYKNQYGNATIVAHVATQQYTQYWAKAGVMFRDGTGADAAFVNVVITPGGVVALQWQSAAGGQCDGDYVSGVSTPQWLKLVRTEDSFSGYYSSDGVTWMLIGTESVAMSSTAKVGLAVTSLVPGTLGTATFDHVSVTADQMVTTITVTPPSANLLGGATQQFTAASTDQFGYPMFYTPAFTWSASAGTITPAGGLFTAPYTPGVTVTITAAVGIATGTASVLIGDTRTVGHQLVVLFGLRRPASGGGGHALDRRSGPGRHLYVFDTERSDG